MQLELKTEYWDDPEARQAFKDFILDIHRLDLDEWEAAGYWDHAYTPFSFFRGTDVIASVCVYLLDVVLDGRPSRLAQISGVGTHPGWRRRGLNRRLTEIGLEWARGKQSGVFLFSDTGAIPFYERCGFQPIEEYVEVAPALPVSPRGGAVRLDPGDESHRARIYDYARRRAPVSNRFGVLNPRLLMFHALYGSRHDVREIPDLECLVFSRREGQRLSLFDIVGMRIPAFRDLYPYLAAPSDRIVEFHFATDRLGLEGAEPRRLLGNNPFVRETFPVERPVFPFTSRA